MRAHLQYFDSTRLDTVSLSRRNFVRSSQLVSQPDPTLKYSRS
jgi:hypothetical protein